MESDVSVTMLAAGGRWTLLLVWTFITQASVQQLDGRIEKLCFFCHQPGHLVADCEAPKRKQQASALRRLKGVGLIKTVSLVGQHDASGEPDACFKLFISKGYVSLTGKAEDQRPVTVLQDTTCSQSLILVGVLALGAEGDVPVK